MLIAASCTTLIKTFRYDVQEKLVNFMAPVHQELPPFVSQLFSNLFAHTA
jgi:hypothetical protein